MQKLSLMLIALFASAGLTACGGGGNDNAGTASTAAPATTTTTATATPVPDCPAGYGSISMGKTSISNMTINLIVDKDTTFLAKVPAGTAPAIKICVGVAAAPFVPPGGLKVASKTYDIKVFALDSSGATLAAVVNPTLTISVPTASLPAGITAQDLSNKAGIYTDSDGGLTSLPITGHSSDASGSVVSAGVSKPGRFVLAYKP